MEQFRRDCGGQSGKLRFFIVLSKLHESLRPVYAVPQSTCKSWLTERWTAMFAASLLRKKKSRVGGHFSAALGYALMTYAAHLGGKMVYEN